MSDGDVDWRDWTPLPTAQRFSLIKERLTDGRAASFPCCLPAPACLLAELPGQVLSLPLDFSDPLTMGSVRTDLPFKGWARVKLWNPSRYKAPSLACEALPMSVLLFRNSNAGRGFYKIKSHMLCWKFQASHRNQDRCELTALKWVDQWFQRFSFFV